MPIINVNYGGSNDDMRIIEGTITGSYENRDITHVNHYAIAYCTDLKSASLPNVLSLDDFCFTGCTSLETVNLPKATTFGLNVFSDCANIKKLYLNKAFVADHLLGENSSINFDLFSEGTIEEWLTMGSHSIGSGTFNLYMNDVLQDHIIVNGNLTIARVAMARCTFSSITFTGNVGKIETSAFHTCTNCTLYDFSNNTTVPTLANTLAFSGINQNAKIVVPDALYNLWIVATNWSNASIVSHIVKASDYTG